MHAAEGAVVDHTLQPWGVGGDAGDGVHGGGGFASGGGDPVGVEDDPPVDVGGAHGDDHELESPCGLTGAFEVQAGVGFEPWGADLTGAPIRNPGFGSVFEQWGHDFAVGVHHP
jgi:hypothetical protein